MSLQLALLECERLLALGVADLADAQHVVKCPRGQRHRLWRRPVTGMRQRVGGGGAAVERHVALGFREQLVHMTVEAGDRGEAAQIAHRLWGVLGSPSPTPLPHEQRAYANT